MSAVVVGWDPTGDLLEREVELGRLYEHLVALASGSGALVVISGEAGIGKTRLLDALCSRASVDDVHVLFARAQVLEQTYPFGVASRLLGPDLVGGSAAPGDLFRALEVCFARLVALAAPRPVLLVVDDGHLADAETLRLLAYVAARLQRLAVLIVVATRGRNETVHRPLLDVLIDQAEVLSPQPHSRWAVAAVVERATGVAAADAFVDAVVHATGGNPFLTVALARALAVDGVEPSEANAGRLNGVVPGTVTRVVLSRLGRLGSDAVTTATALAVLGGRAELGVVAEVAGLAPGAVAEAADQLAGAEILVASRPLEFRHPLVRAAIYGDLPLATRHRLHAQVARRLAGDPRSSTDQIAAHLLVSDPTGDNWSAEVLEQAARAAIEAGAPDAAATYLRRALEEPPAPERRAEVLRSLGTAELRRGAAQAGVDALEAAMDLTPAHTDRAAIAVLLGGPLAQCGQSERATTLILDALSNLGDGERELGLRLEAALTVLADVDAGAARRVKRRPARFAVDRSAPPNTQGERLALAVHADYEMNAGRASEGGRLARLALDGGELMRNEQPGSINFFSTALVLLYCDQLSDAATVYDAAIDNFVRRGAQAAAQVARGFRAGVRYRQGALEEAVADAEAALTVRHPLTLGGMFAVGFLLDALVDMGELERASRLMVELGTDQELPDAVATSLLLHSRGRLRLATAQPAKAFEDFEECGRRSRRWGLHTPAVATWQASSALALDALGRGVDARQNAAEGVAGARAFGAPRSIGVTLVAAGQVSGELSLIEEATQVLRASPARLEYARALVALGSLLRRGRQPREAREPLTEGLRLARLCGAEPLALLAHEELLASGAAPRKIVRGGGNSLTASERRVAQLAATGYSNRQIASELVVGIRTVEAHLARVYQKLDIHDRAALSRALNPP
jgi:DNA-binding CsgD family transcriptional regulator